MRMIMMVIDEKGAFSTVANLSGQDRRKLNNLLSSIFLPTTANG